MSLAPLHPLALRVLVLANGAGGVGGAAGGQASWWFAREEGCSVYRESLLAGATRACGL